jgi:hypothetical protein
VFGMARPARPSAERCAVWEAAALVRAETGITAAEPVAGIVAVRVVEALNAYLDEEMDPLLAAAGELRRQTSPTPYDTLATDPEIDTLKLFVDELVERVKDRCGRRSCRGEEVERQGAWASDREQLKGRYTRALRTCR